jgi:hypothetical protein
VYTAFPFEAIGTADRRDTLMARIVGWLLPGSPDVTPPAAPQGLSATQEYDSVVCRWTANNEPDLAGYRVFRSLQAGLPVWSRIGDVPAPDTVWADTAIAPGVIYHYAVAAYDTANPHNESPWSPWHFLQTVSWSKLGSTGSERSGLPRRYELSPCRPNPVRDGCQIDFALPQPGRAALAVYNVAGQKVRTLIDRTMVAGYHSVRWDGRDDAGAKAGNGVYLYRLEAGRPAFTRTKRLLLVK